MQTFRLPRSCDAPLVFRGEMIVSQSFVDESPAYFDAQGRYRSGVSIWTWTITLYRTDEGRFVYADHTRQEPPVEPESYRARFETAQEYRKSLEQMDAMRGASGFKAGPLRLPTPEDQDGPRNPGNREDDTKAV